jgi:lipopolysaccharide transport system permease protein
MQEIVIEPNKGLKDFWQELWAYRELFYFLAWRDLVVRYKQTVIGVAWSLIRPVLSVIILTLVFGFLAKMPSRDVPYPLVAMAGTLPWQFFASTVDMSSNALLNNTAMITKIYFPRLILPTATLIVSLVDFLISAVFLLILMAWYGLWPTVRIAVVPALIVLAAMASLGLGYWMTALNTKYRDFRHLVPFMIQFGFYASPVGYLSDVVPERWRLLYSLNPMVGVIDGFRWALLGKQTSLFLPGFLLSVALTVLLFVTGLRKFNRTEREFADVI